MVLVGIALVFLGILLIFAGTFLSIIPRGEGARAEVRGGGVILIGPFPIVFGTDAQSVKWLILLAIALMVIAYILLRSL